MRTIQSLPFHPKPSINCTLCHRCATNGFRKVSRGCRGTQSPCRGVGCPRPIPSLKTGSNGSAGGAGGRSPLAGVRGVPAQSPSFSRAAAGGARKVPEELREKKIRKNKMTNSTTPIAANDIETYVEHGYADNNGVKI